MRTSCITHTKLSVVVIPAAVHSAQRALAFCITHAKTVCGRRSGCSAKRGGRVLSA